MQDKEYVLLYEDGNQALFMPGDTKNSLICLSIKKNWDVIIEKYVCTFVQKRISTRSGGVRIVFVLR